MSRIFQLILGLGLATSALGYERLYVLNPASSATNWYPGSSSQSYQYPRYKWSVFNSSGVLQNSGNGALATPGSTALCWQTTAWQSPYYTEIYIATNHGTPPTYYLLATVEVPNETDYTYTLPVWPPGPPPPCYMRASVLNPTDGIVMGWWKKNGTLVHSQMILAGVSATYQFEYVCGSDTLTWGYGVDRTGYTTSTDPFDLTNWQLDWTNIPVIVDLSTGDPTNPPTVYPDAGDTAWSIFHTNGPVNWSGQTNTSAATDTTLQAGFNRLASGQDEQSQILRDLLRSFDQTGGTVAVSNYLTVDTGSITSHLGAIHQSMTNRYEGQFTNMTAGSSSMSNIISSATNRYASVASDLITGMGSVTQMLSNIPIDEEPSALDGLTVTIGGQEWDFNPLNNSNMVQLFSIARKMFAWLLCAGYVIGVLHRVMEVVKVLGTAQQGTNPNVNVTALGFGGNVGVFLSAMIVPLFLIVMGGVCVFLGNMITGSVTAELVTGTLGESPFSSGTGAVAMGVELARHFFPFGLAMTLFASYGTWFGLTILTVASFNIAMRFIWGS